MKKYIVLKLIGLAVLTMITLVIISFLEVALYSYLINPGQAESFYEAHAECTAPYISGIFGFIIFFLVARFWNKKNYPNSFKLAILFPLVYVLLDIIIITAAGVKWSDFFLIFAIANAAKFLGSSLGYKLTK
ncbi:hypothetical protein [Moheibacter sediminis]|uniref:Uncharacterized protein n=1 Tax=Moheibacter sediminis TaxID=1434700 RepID=A0A1W2C7T1_9FLAO|nr:hypothetical protein [Moheibacter sediminis]SMC81325.1 hypothetical protein SAMN06296427_10967 [Moheibacter sediminis]